MNEQDLGQTNLLVFDTKLVVIVWLTAGVDVHFIKNVFILLWIALKFLMRGVIVML